jgi:hypothetical protein
VTAGLLVQEGGGLLLLASDGWPRRGAAAAIMMGLRDTIRMRQSLLSREVWDEQQVLDIASTTRLRAQVRQALRTILRPDTPLDSGVKQMITGQLDNAEDRFAVICHDHDADSGSG